MTPTTPPAAPPPAAPPKHGSKAPVAAHFAELIDAFYRQKARNQTKSLESALSEDLSIDPSLLKYVIPATPDVIASKIDGSIKPMLFEFWNMDGKSKAISLTPLNRVLAAHSLSPMSDSLFILCDLGRASRIAGCLGLELSVLLADSDWSRRNWNVAVFGERNLAANLAWRKQIYKSVGAKVHICGLRNLPDPPSRGKKTPDLENLASQFTQFCIALLGDDSVHENLSPNQRARFRTVLAPPSMATSGITRIEFVHDRLSAEIGVVRKILDEFRLLGESTFLYFLAQRYHQFGFPDALKVSVTREKSFDEPFYELDVADYGKPHGVSRAIYLEDYLLRDPHSGENFSIHPYCFPSGTAFSRFPELEECLALCPHLDDLPNKSSLRPKLANLTSFQLARVLADLLSFIHFFGRPTRTRLIADIRDILRPVSEEWASSWRNYSLVPADFHTRVLHWAELAFSRWSNDVQLPYFFFPFDTELIESEAALEVTVEVCARLATELEPQLWTRGGKEP